MKQYRPRVVDAVLARKLEGMGAVLIEGAKWCGKTTTAEQIAGSVLNMDDQIDTFFIDLLKINVKRYSALFGVFYGIGQDVQDDLL